MKSHISERLKEALLIRGLTQAELANKCNLNKGALSSYINKRYEPKRDSIQKLAEALRVNPAWLMGFDVPMESSESAILFEPSNMTFKLPFVNQKLSAGCGENFLAPEDIEVKEISLTSHLPSGVAVSSLIAAEVKGDSMINANIYPGDIVIFSKGLISGDGIYVVSAFGEVLIKRIQFDAFDNTVTLISENPKYPPKTISAENVVVLGKVIKWIHNENF